MHRKQNNRKRIVKQEYPIINFSYRVTTPEEGIDRIKTLLNGFCVYSSHIIDYKKQSDKIKDSFYAEVNIPAKGLASIIKVRQLNTSQIEDRLDYEMCFSPPSSTIRSHVTIYEQFEKYRKSIN